MPAQGYQICYLTMLENAASSMPEKRLLIEVLRQAIRDIIDKNKGKRCAESQYRRGALNWLRSETIGYDKSWFTFAGVCEELELDKEAVRKAIFASVEEPDFAARFERRSSDASYPRKMGRQTDALSHRISRLERDQGE